MRLAFISDIHGNLPALRAVLGDAANRNVDRYFFLGDYFQDFPYPNEIVRELSSVKNAVYVRGNKEEGLAETGRKIGEKRFEQFAALDWNLEHMSEQSYNWLVGLPEKNEYSTDDCRVFSAHSVKNHFGVLEFGLFRSYKFAKEMDLSAFSHEEHLQRLRQAVSGNTELINAMNAAPGGIFAMGHSHVQWFLQMGGKLLINPGSCGLPLDMRPGAPYSIVETGSNGYSVEEYRAEYDINELIRGLRLSEFYAKSKIWSDLTIEALKDARDRFAPFLELAESIASEKNDETRPFCDEIWRESDRLRRASEQM